MLTTSITIILTLLVNIVVAGFCIGVGAFYYTPGNPVTPNNLLIDIISCIGMFIGISQFIYIAPLILLNPKGEQRCIFRGLTVGAIITIILDATFLLIVVSNGGLR